MAILRVDDGMVVFRYRNVDFPTSLRNSRAEVKLS
jgi:hypothetical protein